MKNSPHQFYFDVDYLIIKHLAQLYCNKFRHCE